MTIGLLRKGTVAAAALVAAAAAAAAVKCHLPDGKIPEVTELVDDEIAFAGYAETASVVAFDRLPRSNLLHSWKSLGVTLLKTIRLDAEMSPERYRREAGFLAFLAGADGLYLVGEPKGEYARALEEAKTDWRVLLRLRELREAARASADGLVRIEGRRAMYCMQGFLPAEEANVDALRLEAVAWAKRLEQVLGVPPADLPTALPAKPLADYAVFTPYGGLSEPPKLAAVGEERKTVKVAPGVEFRWSIDGFEVTVENRTGKEMKEKGDCPGGALRLRLYIPGSQPGEWMPYRFYCDLNPTLKGTVRAPAIGRGANLFGTDERFLPYAQTYGARNDRLCEWPCLRSHGPDCPALHPKFSFVPVKGGGYRATFQFDWMPLYGHWPQQGADPKGTVWYLGVDDFPRAGEQVVCRLQWPRPSEQAFDRFCGRFSTKAITSAYKDELARVYDGWMLGFRDRYYRFLKTKEPCFNLGDYESDEMFRQRLVQPLLDANDNAWQLICDDKEHPSPKLRKQLPLVQKRIHRMLGRMFHFSHAVWLQRRDYLAGRFAGRVPPEPKRKAGPVDLKTPDADFDDGAMELDDKEF